MADFRDEFLRHLIEVCAEDYSIVVYVGDRYFDGTTRTSDFVRHHPSRRRAINWRYRSSVGLQWMDYRAVWRSDVAVLEFNPRILNTWMLTLARRPSDRRTLLWGHAWSRAGEDSRTESVRAAMRRSADGLILYSAEQKRELLRRCPGTDSASVFVATNALYRRSRIAASPPAGSSFVCVGRLAQAKKPRMLIESFLMALPSLPGRVVLHMVGEGPQRDELERLVARAGADERVRFHGHVADVERLREIYAECLFSVSPGYVGLSAIQSLSFGRPVLLSREEPHAPEIDALRSDENALCFPTDDRRALADALCRVVVEEKAWQERFESIARACRENYSVEAMVRGFREALDG